MKESASPRAADRGRSRGALFPLEEAPQDASFGPTRRVRKRSDFALLRAEGTKAGATRHFTWVVRPRTRTADADAAADAHDPGHDSGETRLGLVVSTRAGNAVVRNRLKRWSRELFRTQRDKLPKGMDLLLIYRPQASPTTLAELAREWRKALVFLRAVGAPAPPAAAASDAPDDKTPPGPSAGRPGAA